MTPEKLMATVRDKFFPHAQKAMGFAQYHSALLAVPLRGEACLIEFDRGNPEQKTAEGPFVSIGGGCSLADPVLALFGRVFWAKGELPKLSDGKFIAVWTLYHAINCSPGGVAEPVQVMVIEHNKDGEYAPRPLPEHELEEHRQAIDDAEAHLAEYRTVLQTTGQAETPPKPHVKGK